MRIAGCLVLAACGFRGPELVGDAPAVDAMPDSSIAPTGVCAPLPVVPVSDMVASPGAAG